MEIIGTYLGEGATHVTPDLTPDAEKSRYKYTENQEYNAA